MKNFIKLILCLATISLSLIFGTNSAYGYTDPDGYYYHVDVKEVKTAEQIVEEWLSGDVYHLALEATFRYGLGNPCKYCEVGWQYKFSRIIVMEVKRGVYKDARELSRDGGMDFERALLLVWGNYSGSREGFGDALKEYVRLDAELKIFLKEQMELCYARKGG